jgi:hypothetical protein
MRLLRRAAKGASFGDSAKVTKLVKFHKVKSRMPLKDHQKNYRKEP